MCIRDRHRKPGSTKFEQVTWDFAMERIAKLMKDDRDANFVERNRDGVIVNRWPTMGFLQGCATSNETTWATYKLVRGLGILAEMCIRDSPMDPPRN